MFGYARPQKSELKISEYDAYRAVYCGLCHTLSKRYGFFARFTTNYDFTLLAMLLSGGDYPPDENNPADSFKPEYIHKRCVASPLIKKCVCAQNSALDIAADLSVILYYWKLRDTIGDENIIKSASAGLASLLLKRSYKKAAKLRPDFADTVKARLSELNILEKNNCPSLDTAADKFALLLSEAGEYAVSNSGGRALRHLLYHIGRSIYILDAINDLEEDFRKGKYNPLIYDLSNDKLSDSRKEALFATLNLSFCEIRKAYYIAEPFYYGAIIENIIGKGLPLTTKLVFGGNYSRQKKKGNLND